MQVTLVAEPGPVHGSTLAEIAPKIPAAGPCWVDVFDPDASVDLTQLGTVAGLEPSDAQWLGRADETARFEMTEERVRAVVPCYADGAPIAVHMVAARRMMVTVHHRGPEIFTPMVSRPADLSEERTDADVVLVVDDLVRTFRPVVSSLRAELESLEVEILRDPERDHVRRLAEVRSQSGVLRRALEPYAESISDFRERLPLATFPDDAKALAESHADRVAALLDALGHVQESASHAMESYVSMIATRQGQVINWLTLLSMVFLPLTFLTGFFGMNFNWMVDAIDGPWWFLALGIVLPALTVAGVFFLARNRGWLRIFHGFFLPGTDASPDKASG
jgi:magnesium transporter